MLTVDFDRLGVEAGDVLLDMGAGGGRHAFEAYRRRATVLALDLSRAELREVLDTMESMVEAGEVPDGTPGGAAVGDALELPLADASVDRIIASEVLEHVDDDHRALDELFRVLRPGGTIAVTVPSWLPEWVCWSISDDYHAPAVVGGHVRIYTKAELDMKVQRAGFEVTGARRTHGLHSPYWWLRCAVGPQDADHPLVRPYRKLLEWDIVRRPVVTRVVDDALSPVLGKSLVLYARRPATQEAARAA